MAAAPFLWLRRLTRLGQNLRLPALVMSEPLGHEIGDWVHLEAIQALVFHATAVVATLLLTALTGYVIQRVMRKGPIKRIVILIDQAAAALLILFFVAELALYFWHK
jgi:hypothetical protein